MKNKYSSSNSIIYISIPHTREDGRDDSVTPVFASRESLLKA